MRALGSEVACIYRVMAQLDDGELLIVSGAMDLERPYGLSTLLTKKRVATKTADSPPGRDTRRGRKRVRTEARTATPNSSHPCSATGRF
jgi:hypothetical protein